MQNVDEPHDQSEICGYLLWRAQRKCHFLEDIGDPVKLLKLLAEIQNSDFYLVL